MAAKRRADTDLNRDNWDQEDEVEDVGCFEPAPEEVLVKRVIKTAKRRITNPSNTESGTKSLFSGFSGFTSNTSNVKPSFSFLASSSDTSNTNHTDSQKSSFSFLSNENNANCSEKPSFSFSSNTNTTGAHNADKPLSFMLNSKQNIENDTNKKPSFSFLSNTKPNNSSGDSKKSIENNTEPKKFAFSVPSDVKTNNNETNEHLPTFKNQSTLNELEKLRNTEKLMTKSCGDEDEKNSDEIFLQKLRSLNLLCAEWIIKHLNENLSYILTPVFDDYKKYLDQLKEERRANNTSSKKAKIEIKPDPPASVSTSITFKSPDFKESLGNANFKNFFSRPLEKQENEETKCEKKSTFEFGKIKPEETFKLNNSPMFRLGTSSTSETKSEEIKTNDPPKMSFFAFGANEGNQFKNPFFNNTNSVAPTTPVAISRETPVEDDAENEPPVLEDASIKEEGSVYDKKCKVYIKKDGSFVDHGVGFLFLKLIGEEKKCQLIVRANNKLATIIINVLLNSSIPLEKKGKNNVMVVCCPTPEAKPSAILLKVKTEEDANQLLEMMNKHVK